jgi:hypothetical protein
MPTTVLGNPLRLLAASAILLLPLFLISCGSSNGTNVVCPGTSAATCTCACPVHLNEYLYTSGSSGQVLEFNITTSTGVLSNLNSTEAGPASVGIALVADQFIYISDPSHAQLDGFSFNQDGSLNTLAGSPFSVGQSCRRD